MQHEFHEFASMFPLMEGTEFDELVSDIEKHGQRELIVILDGKVLDGRNRYLACKRLGIAPRLREFNCVDGDPLDFVWSANVRRRHLSQSQKAMAIAKRVQFAKVGRPELNRPNGTIITEAEASKISGVARRTIARAKAVVQHGSKEEINDIETGKRKLYNVEFEMNAKRRANGTMTTRGCSSHGGATINPPKGVTIKEWIKQGMDLEKSGVSMDEVINKLKIGRRTYHRFSTLISLAERDDLPDHEKKLIDKVLYEMIETKQTSPYEHKGIRKIQDRVWGDHQKTEKGEASKLAKFEHTVQVIVTTCMAKVDIPQIPKERAIELVEELEEAESNINGLVTKLKEIYHL